MMISNMRKIRIRKLLSLGHTLLCKRSQFKHNILETEGPSETDGGLSNTHEFRGETVEDHFYRGKIN